MAHEDPAEEVVDPAEEVVDEKPALYHNVFEAPMDDEEDMENMMDEEDMMDEDNMMDEEMEMEPEDEEEEEHVEDVNSYTSYTPTKLVHTWRQASTTVDDYTVPTFADYYD